jgi:hypothetical protein
MYSVYVFRKHACYIEINMVYILFGFWWRNLKERDHWGEPDIDGRIILRWIFKK